MMLGGPSFQKIWWRECVICLPISCCKDSAIILKLILRIPKSVVKPRCCQGWGRGSGGHYLPQIIGFALISRVVLVGAGGVHTSRPLASCTPANLLLVEKAAGSAPFKGRSF